MNIIITHFNKCRIMKRTIVLLTLCTVFCASLFAQNTPFNEESESGAITMDKIAVGTNIRGWEFEIDTSIIPTKYDPAGTLFVNTMSQPAIYAQTNPGGYDIGTYAYSVELPEGYSICIGSVWRVTYFKIKDDKDYIVISNSLIAGTETTWGFDRIKAYPPIELIGGTISGNQIASPDSVPSTPMMSIVPASGGAGPITYQWQKSNDNSSWSPIASGGSSETYMCNSTLDNTTYFRRKATSASKTAYSNTVVVSVMSATNDANYIRTRTYTAENNSAFVTDTEYYDGLGYPSQSVNIGASPDGTKNIITPIEYNFQRRESKKHLPYVGDNIGTYISSSVALTFQKTYYDEK
jgi:hypothetical protein